jgi:phage terminase large subunit
LDINSLSDLDKSKAKEKLIAYQKDPILFCKEILGITTHWGKQVEILKAVAAHRRVEVHSGHDVGKSFVAADVALWFLFTHPNSIVITTAPTWRQVEKVLWGEINHHFKMSKFFLGGKALETEIKIGPKWYAIGFSSDTPDAYQGFHADYVLVIEDEPSGIEDIVDEQIQTILANENTKLLKIGNPTRTTGHFAESIRSDKYHHIHINCWESPNVIAGKMLYPGLVTRQWCEEKLEEWGEDSPVYQSRVLGNIPKEDADTLIKLEWIERSIKRHTTFRGGSVSKTVISCDVARFGKNKTVIIVRHGRRVSEILSFARQDTYDTALKLDELIKKHNPEHVVIDDNGVGGGVVDDLIHWGHKMIVRVNAGENADEDDKYTNKRSELATRVRVAFKRNEIDIPDHEQLVFECNNQFFDLDGLQRIRVMSKSLMKKRGLESPDFFDALYLSYAREIPDSLARHQAQYVFEFEDSVHIQKINHEAFMMGVSRFNVIVPVVNGATACIWAVADKHGKVFIYKEAIVERTTSRMVADTMAEFESGSLHQIDERYINKVPLPDEVSKKRYTFIEQLEDEGLLYDEIEYDPELAAMNIREGLYYDKKVPVGKDNMPHLFIHPDCRYVIQSIKYMLNPKVLSNDPMFESFHKAVGVLVMAEPMWLKSLDNSRQTEKEEVHG